MLYSNVLSTFQTKPRGKSAFTSADYLLPTPKLEADTIAEDLCTLKTPSTPSELIACAVFPLEKMNEADHFCSLSFPTLRNSIGIILPIYSH